MQPVIGWPHTFRAESLWDELAIPQLGLVGDDAFVGRLLDESCGYGAEARLQQELTPCALRQAELPSDRAFSSLPRCMQS